MTLFTIFALAGLLIYIFRTPDAEVVSLRRDSSISRVTEYTVTEVAAPGTPLGIVQEYRFPVDEQMARTDLVFLAHHQYIRVFLDGKLLYSWTPAGAAAMGKTLGSRWISVPFYRGDLGGEVTVEVTPVYDSSVDEVPEFLLGDSQEIYNHQFQRDIVPLALSLLIVIISVMFLCVAAARMFRSRQGHSLTHLSMFAGLIGLWRLTNIPFVAYLFAGQSVFLYDLSLVSLMLCMMPLTVYVGHTQQYHWPSDLYCIASSVACLTQIVLRVFFGVDFRDMLIVTHAFLVLGVLSIVLLVYLNRHSQKLRNTPPVMRLLPLLCVAGVSVDLVMYYIDGGAAGLTYSLLSVLLYIMIAGTLLIHKFYNQEKKLVTQQSQLLEARTAVMLSQIQPHFLYNALNSIAELCREDAAKARSATIDFAEYLRVNLKAIQQKKVVPFREELAHVQRYLNLEKMRFEDDLTVIYDIQTTDFSLPQLSVQPLVENAVKHGIGEQEDGGTVTVRSWEEADCWCLSIEDNGVGFDAERILHDGKVHIGIDNSRLRLMTLCGGTLEITSQIGQGTTAVIRIPKEEEK